MGRFKDLTGKKFNNLLVIKKIDNKSEKVMWLCKCDCGKETIGNSSSIKNGYKKSCGCLRNKIKNILGEKFGRLKVIKYLGLNEDGKTIWKCECECGNIKTIRGSALLSGRTKSCGCLQKDINKENSFKDITGKRYGRLVVMSYNGLNKKGKREWNCKCDCGNEVSVLVTNLTKNKTKSCGCLAKDVTKKYFAEKRKYIIGKRFGKLIVDFETEEVRNGSPCYSCICDCGKRVIVTMQHLVQNHTKSCGCLVKNRKFYNNLKQKIFGNLTVIDYSHVGKDHNSYWKCKCSCGRTCVKNGRSLTRGDTTTCGKCRKISFGEKRIISFLDKYNIEFIHNKIFKDCIYIKPLRFDFYLEKLNICIEYDGEQHFEKTNAWRTKKDNFKKTRERDETKNKYCQNNNIKLIRIPYWDYSNIEEILMRELNLCKN